MTTEAMQAVICAELQQFLGEMFHELDNDGLNITDFYCADGTLEVAGQVFKGHAGIKKFYSDRLEQVRAARGGVRTTRHIYVNLRVVIEDRDHASLDCISLTYAGSGAPPVMNLIGPAFISDVHMHCERAGAHRWLLRRFVGEAIFVGNDPLMSEMAGKR